MYQQLSDSDEAITKLLNSFEQPTITEIIEFKNIFGSSSNKQKTQITLYQPVVSLDSPVEEYRDPAITETRVHGAYTDNNPMNKAYKESTDTSNGYSGTIRISAKGRRGSGMKTQRRW